MSVGSRSLLWGIHAFWLHPFFVAAAWNRLYSFPWDWRLIICFIVHDWGYWSVANMDGPEGKLHPRVGARIARRLCGEEYERLVLYHSRHYSSLMGHEPSALCAPDKLASALYPEWLYLTLATLSGEIEEYMREENCRVLEVETGIKVTSKRTFFRALKKYLEKFGSKLPPGGM